MDILLQLCVRGRNRIFITMRSYCSPYLSCMLIWWTHTLKVSNIIGKGYLIITNLACDELIMKTMWSSLIHKFIQFEHKYHALKTSLTYEYIYWWMKYKPMNESMSHESFHKLMCQMCFQCTISKRKMYKLWMNEFCTISIIKSLNVKFVISKLFMLNSFANKGL